MAHIIALLIIAAAKIIKWILIKQGSSLQPFPLRVLIFFENWYEANKLMADGISITLIAGVAVSWIVTLVKYIKVRKHNKELTWIGHMNGTDSPSC